ncbi:hypothetical protein BDW59DRAFT_167524 [Aspergillus cavernicola]|uniref:C2H2-type domain-containing protein n=1 Tax=Aspergillus cavernicola TaxID=176166 RepID=A0ABR4HD49_9EURO
MEWPISSSQPTDNSNPIHPFSFNRFSSSAEAQRMVSFPNNDPDAYESTSVEILTSTNDIVQDRRMPVRSRGYINLSTINTMPCIQQSAVSANNPRRGIPLEAATYYPPSTPFAPALQESINFSIMERDVGHPQNISSNTGDRHASDFHIAPSFQCKWEGCTSISHFARAIDLIRHIKTIHISPKAYPCLVKNCGKAFGRRDHLQEHTRRRHHVG